MTDKKFEKGDEVYHRSGGPKMVIVENYGSDKQYDYKCSYYQDDFMRRKFYKEELRKADSKVGDDYNLEICKKCGGSGIIQYGSGAGSDVHYDIEKCDNCNGSGKVK